MKVYILTIQEHRSAGMAQMSTSGSIIQHSSNKVTEKHMYDG